MTVPVPVSVPGKRFRRFRFHVRFLRKRFRRFRFPVPVRFLGHPVFNPLERGGKRLLKRALRQSRPSICLRRPKYVRFALRLKQDTTVLPRSKWSAAWPARSRAHLRTLHQPAPPKYHTKGVHTSVDSPGARTLVFAALNDLSLFWLRISGVKSANTLFFDTLALSHSTSYRFQLGHQDHLTKGLWAL